ncbi:hypothetical protein BS78_05G205500 [Paspalum vaginatum]|nr:hypothetical protein BS78_05G205500 [Paspalum vaginatum]
MLQLGTENTGNPDKESIDGCVSLLQFMQLEGEEEEMQEVSKDLQNLESKEEGWMNLPGTWVEDLQKGVLPEHEDDKEELLCSTQPSNDLLEKVKGVASDEVVKDVKKNVWGPIQATRRSQRGVTDGRTVLQKAQDGKRKWNLEEPAEHRMEVYVSSLLANSKSGSGMVYSVPGRQMTSFGGNHTEAKDCGPSTNKIVQLQWLTFEDDLRSMVLNLVN